jgi:hypothetical protein
VSPDASQRPQSKQVSLRIRPIDISPPNHYHIVTQSNSEEEVIMSSRLFIASLALLISSSSFAFTDSLWAVGGGGYRPGELVTVEVWLQYEGGGPGDSMAHFDILLTWDAGVCTVEALTIGSDFAEWDDYAWIDNQGTQGPPSVPKLMASAFTFGPPIGPPYIPRGTHHAATISFRTLGTITPLDSTYIDTLMKGFTPVHYLGFTDKVGISRYTPSYAGVWITATGMTGDIGPTSIVGPPAVVFADSTYYPSAVVWNFGPDSVASIPVICTIHSWADTAEIEGIRGFDSTIVSFAEWTVPEPKFYSLIVITKYVEDPNLTNDTLSILISAYPPGDPGPISVPDPPDSVRPDYSYRPSAMIKNFGADSIGPLPVICKIGSWVDTAEISLIAGLDSSAVDFDVWTVPDTGMYTVTIFTEYHADTNTVNDTLRKSVWAYTYPGGPDIVWQRKYGGLWTDIGTSVQQTSDGGYIVAGVTHLFEWTEGDVYLVKTDAEGDPVWTKTFGHWWGDEGRSVRQTSDGGYIVAGCASGDPSPYQWMYLIKTDPHGNRSWSKCVGTGYYRESGNSVRQTYDGSYIVVGSRYHDNWPELSREVYLVKISGSGNFLWQKVYGEVRIDEWGYEVEGTADSGYVIAGNKELPSGDSDVYVIKTDRNGDVLWERTYGGDGADVGRSVKQTMDGGYVIAGETKSFGEGETDVYLVKTDESGNVLWERSYGGRSDDLGRSICTTSDGNYVVVGTTKSFGTGGEDVWLIKIDTNGNVIWAETYGRSDYDVGRSVEETSDGGYIIAGSTYSIGGRRNVYLIKTKDWVGVQEERLPEKHSLVCRGKPNPFTDRTAIQYELPERRNIHIVIYNLLGQEVRTLFNEEQDAGLHTVIWNGRDNTGRKVSSGTYFLRLEAEKQSITKKLCVVR